jgi:hypothetical protein
MAMSLFQRLRAASRWLDRPQAQIISDALEAYLDALPAKDRQQIDAHVARSQKTDKA